MDFALTSDQDALKSSVRDFLQAECTSEVVRKSYSSGGHYDAELWSHVVSLGWTGLVIPEEFGGAGVGWLECALLAEEMGRFLFPGPYLSNLLASTALLLGGTSEQRSKYLPKLADGSIKATVAIFEGRSVHSKDIRMKARPSGSGFVIDGTKLFVLDGESADLYFVAVQAEDGVDIAIVDPSKGSVTAEALPTVDKTRPTAAVTFSEVPVGEEDFLTRANGLLDRVRDRACLFLAAENAGIASKCLEMCAEYAKTRMQFGKPIGSYQAVSHKIADMYLAAEHSKSLVYYAGWAADQAVGPDLETPEYSKAAIAAWEARIWGHQAASKATADAIQVHGGIGFTWEHDLHMYFKRARSNDVILDEPDLLKDLISKHVHG